VEEAAQHEPVTLTTIASGAALELFDQELDKVLQNVLDPNTEAKSTREIVIKVKLTPDDNRDVGHVQVTATSKLAPFRSAGGTVFVAKVRGKAVAVAHNPHQVQLQFDAGQNRPTPLKGTDH